MFCFLSVPMAADVSPWSASISGGGAGGGDAGECFLATLLPVVFVVLFEIFSPAGSMLGSVAWWTSLGPVLGSTVRPEWPSLIDRFDVETYALERMWSNEFGSSEVSTIDVVPGKWCSCRHYGALRRELLW